MQWGPITDHSASTIHEIKCVDSCAIKRIEFIPTIEIENKRNKRDKTMFVKLFLFFTMNSSVHV